MDCYARETGRVLCSTLIESMNRMFGFSLTNFGQELAFSKAQYSEN